MAGTCSLALGPVGAAKAGDLFWLMLFHAVALSGFGDPYVIDVFENTCCCSSDSELEVPAAILRGFAMIGRCGLLELEVSDVSDASGVLGEGSRLVGRQVVLKAMVVAGSCMAVVRLVGGVVKVPSLVQINVMHAHVQFHVIGELVE